MTSEAAVIECHAVKVTALLVSLMLVREETFPPGRVQQATVAQGTGTWERHTHHFFQVSSLLPSPLATRNTQNLLIFPA
jgi:hypothetical protein